MKHLLLLFIILPLLIVGGCDVKKNKINKEISTLEASINELKNNIINNQKLQMKLIKDHYKDSLIPDNILNAYIKNYFSPYVEKYSLVMFDNSKKVSSKNAVVDIVAHLINLYDGNEPYQYAFLTLYDSINWNVKIFKVLKEGSLVSISEKCMRPECDTFYVYIEGLKGVDNQILKQELFLSYEGSYTHNIAILDVETVPYYKIIRKIPYSNDSLIKKYITYLDTKQNLDTEVQYANTSSKSKRNTIKTLDSIDNSFSVNDYDIEFAQNYIKLNITNMEAIYSYKKSRIDFVKSTSKNLAGILKNDTYEARYNSSYTKSKSQLAQLYTQYNDMLKRLNNLNVDIVKLKNSLN